MVIALGQTQLGLKDVVRGVRPFDHQGKRAYAGPRL